VGGLTTITLYPPINIINELTPFWNTHCILEFVLTSVTQIEDQAIEASVTGPTPSVINNPVSLTIPAKSLVSFTYTPPGTITSLDSRFFTVEYNIDPNVDNFQTTTKFEARFTMSVHNIHTFTSGVASISTHTILNLWGANIYFSNPCCK